MPNGQVFQFKTYRTPYAGTIIDAVSTFCSQFEAWRLDPIGSQKWDFIRNIFRLIILEIMIASLWWAWKGSKADETP